MISPTDPLSPACVSSGVKMGWCSPRLSRPHLWSGPLTWLVGLWCRCGVGGRRKVGRVWVVVVVGGFEAFKSVDEGVNVVLGEVRGRRQRSESFGGWDEIRGRVFVSWPGALVKGQGLDLFSRFPRFPQIHDLRRMQFPVLLTIFALLSVDWVDSYNLSSKSAVQSRSLTSSSFTPSLSASESSSSSPSRTTGTLGFVLAEPSNEGGMVMKKGKPNVPPMMRGQYKQQQQM